MFSIKELFSNEAGHTSMAPFLMFGSFLVSSSVLLMMAYNKMSIDAPTFLAYLSPFTFNSVGKAVVKAVSPNA